MSAAGRRWGLRREAPILLPAALVLFAVLALLTLALYRSAVDRFALERQAEALGLAERWAAGPGRPSAERLEALRRGLPLGGALAILDGDGRAVVASGPLAPPAPPDALLAEARRGRSAVAGPERTLRPAVVALVPLAGAGEPRALLVELPAPTLAAQRRTLAMLTPLVLVLAAAAALVVTLYLAALLRPFDALLARARAAPGGDAAAPADEMEFLLATFDRALGALGTPRGDLAPLAGALGGALDGGFVLLDPDGRSWAMTPAAALLGVAAPEAGTPIADALAGMPPLARALAAALAARQPVARSTVHLDRDGRELTLDWSAEPLRGEGGHLRGWLVVLADSTEQERTRHRERLADSLAQLGELSAGVAHELRNGLAAVAGWVELAERRRPDAATAADLAEIARECRQLARVVGDFLAFAQPGTRRLERCDLVALLVRAASAGGLAAGEWTLAPPPGAAELVADEQLLERAFRNLLANAAAARREAGAAAPVEIAVAPRDGGFAVSIADRGPGIPPALRARLFEPFVSARPGGVGLGLALARRILVLHGGTIAAGAREGGGALFEVWLPIDTSATVRSESEPLRSAPQSPTAGHK